MNITSATYIKDDDGNNIAVSAIINGRQWSVPINMENGHYQKILEWVAEGNTIEETS